MASLFLPVIIGTMRPKRESIKPANYVLQILSTYPDVETLLVDPLNFTLPFDGNDDEVKDPRYTAITQRADGFIIVTPEYNHSFPGSLKRLLDSESNFKNYIHKPVAFVGVSDGSWGGVRAIEALVTTTRELGLVACSKDVQFAKVPELFDEHGVIKDPVSYERRVRRMIQEFLWMANVLKHGRDMDAAVHESAAEEQTQPAVSTISTPSA